jgi:hypothetical protein
MRKAVQWFALVLAIAAYADVTYAPMYAWEMTTVTADKRVAPRTTSGWATSRKLNGSRVSPILVAPVLAALVTLLRWPGRRRGVLRAVGACISVLFVLVASMSVGEFVLPSARPLWRPHCLSIGRPTGHLTDSRQHLRPVIGRKGRLTLRLDFASGESAALRSP